MASQMLLIGWEAADWRILHPLIDAGEMPVLRRMVEGGASGQLLGAQPLASVVQWTTISTGKRPWQHQVCHPIEKFGDTNEAIPVNGTQRRSLALWEMLAQQGKRSLVVGWPATHSGQIKNGVIVSDRYAQPTAGPGIKPWPPAAPGTYWPEETGSRLNRWRISPEEIQADIISLCVPDWKKIDQKRDRRLGQLRLLLAKDFSHQAALMTLLAESEWDFAAVHFPALGAISQLFLAHHWSPPNPASEPERGLYANVVRGACRLLDQMLGKLVRTVGKEGGIILVSGHGVARYVGVSPAHSVGADEGWKSPHGVFVACGPGLASDALVHGATVLDITPTVLTWFGLPIGDDMEGRVLSEGFASAPLIAHVPTWESAKATDVARVVADSSSNPKRAATLQREWDWNLAQSYLEAARYEEALPILEQLFRGFPERLDLSYGLFQCQLAVRRLSHAAETLEVILEELPAGVASLLARAELCVAQGKIAEAHKLVNEVRRSGPMQPDELRRVGLLLLQLRDWNALAELAAQALKVDEDDAVSWLGLAEAQLRKKLPAEAEESALRAIGLNFYLPDAHFVLARARVAQGKWQQAQAAIKLVLQLQPKHRAASIYARRIQP